MKNKVFLAFDDGLFNYIDFLLDFKLAVGFHEDQSNGIKSNRKRSEKCACH